MPTFYKYFEEYTGIPVDSIPMNDPKVYSLLTSPEALGVTPEQIDSQTGKMCIRDRDKESAKSLTKILLTASGGPFFGMKTEELRGKTKADALKHPNWNMGAKITIDSATLMNKGLELIEAVWLFGLPPAKIQIVVQRQSIVHSAVQYSDCLLYTSRCV